jgi:hypothetical protein
MNANFIVAGQSDLSTTAHVSAQMTDLKYQLAESGFG